MITRQQAKDEHVAPHRKQRQWHNICAAIIRDGLVDEAIARIDELEED